MSRMAGVTVLTSAVFGTASQKTSTLGRGGQRVRDMHAGKRNTLMSPWVVWNVTD